MKPSRLPIAERIGAALVLAGCGAFIGGPWIAGLAFIAGCVAIGCSKAAKESDDGEAEANADVDGFAQRLSHDELRARLERQKADRDHRMNFTYPED